MLLARTVRNSQLDSRSARARLARRAKPFYQKIEEGLHLGYRKPKEGAGKWLARHYVGQQAYELETIAIADDLSEADGTAVLSYSQAQALTRQRMVQRAHAVAGKTGPVTVHDAVETYLDFLDANRKSGVDARHRARAFIYPELATTEVEKLTAERLRRWHLDLTKTAPRVRTKTGANQRHKKLLDDDDSRRRRRSSANRVLTILKGALNRLWREGKVSSDSAWRRVEPFEDVDAARIRYLSIVEAKRLLNAAAADFRSLVQGALQTGARYGEITRLQVADYNADAGTVAIRTSKSGKPRHVVLTDEGMDFFAGHTVGRSGASLMFEKANGTAWAASHQNRPMADACRNGSVTPPISFHGLRHTWASLAVMNSTPLMVVARNLGHADTRMVEKHYGHLAPSFVADAIRAGAPRFGEVDRGAVALLRPAR